MITSKHFDSIYPETSREEEIRQIVSFVREGNSCQLIGLPGAGRSSVLGLLAHNHAIHLKHFPTTHNYIHFVYINLSEARRRPLLDVVKLLFLSLVGSLRERQMLEEFEQVNSILKESLELQDELVISQGLKRAVDYLSVEKKLTLIFLFDRFEEYIPSATLELFMHLRMLRNRAKYRFSVVFSLLRPLEDTLDVSVLTDFYELIGGHYVWTRLFDPVSMEFRTSYIEKMTGKLLSKGQKEEILTLTGGHAKVARLAVEAHLANSNQYSATNTQELLLSQLTIRNGLLEIWQSLTPSEQDYLQKNNGNEQAKAYLEKVGLIKENKCCIPLLLAYAEDSRRIASMEKAPILYNEADKTIKKGDFILSDNLTTSEFRFLRHLISHPNVIIDREEVISVVWKESASTEGVTDQAVDQLVFRLRRKIEDDPNSPKHIHTVKGRGFKFSP